MQPFEGQPFKQEPPVERAQHDGPLNVKVVVNFAPQDCGFGDAAAARHERAAFDSAQHRARSADRQVLDRRVQHAGAAGASTGRKTPSQIDFPALGKALNSLNLGTVDLKTADAEARRHGVPGDLITKELKDEKQQPDAVIFAGPKVILEEGLPQDTLKQLIGRETACLLHELQSESAGQPLAGRDRGSGEIPERRANIRFPDRATCSSPGPISSDAL